jgi:chitinase
MSVINAMLRARVELTGVNVMTMDFTTPPGPGSTMLKLSEQAASSAHKQLQTDLSRYGIDLSSEQTWQRMGISVMIGQNDVQGEVFTTGDAAGLVHYSKDVDLGRLSMWSLNRDSECGQAYGENGVLSNSCSGVTQAALGFSQAFGDLNGIAPVATAQVGIVPPAPDLNPANALYPLWIPTAEYQAGYKVVQQGYIYEAKWYNAGQDPAQVWSNSYEDPWDLLGPVLPTDKAPTVPTLPAGTYPAWSPQKGYAGGKRVLYQGLPYAAKWYNEGASPAEEAADPSDSPWQPLFTLPGEPASNT